jgi:hypothetical protein
MSEEKNDSSNMIILLVCFCFVFLAACFSVYFIFFNDTEPTPTPTTPEIEEEEEEVTTTRPKKVTTTRPKKVTTSPIGVTTSPIGVTTSPIGVTTSPIGVTTSPIGVTTSPIGVTTGPPLTGSLSNKTTLLPNTDNLFLKDINKIDFHEYINIEGVYSFNFIYIKNDTITYNNVTLSGEIYNIQDKNTGKYLYFNGTSLMYDPVFKSTFFISRVKSVGSDLLDSDTFYILVSGNDTYYFLLLDYSVSKGTKIVLLDIKDKANTNNIEILNSWMFAPIKK